MVRTPQFILIEEKGSYKTYILQRIKSEIRLIFKSRAILDQPHLSVSKIAVDKKFPLKKQ